MTKFTVEIIGVETSGYRAEATDETSRGTWALANSPLLAATTAIELLLDSKPKAPKRTPECSNPERYYGRNDIEVVLRDAINSKRSVYFQYTDSAGQRSVRHVRPNKFEGPQTRVYVLGWDLDRDAIRSFVIDRIEWIHDKVAH